MFSYWACLRCAWFAWFRLAGERYFARLVTNHPRRASSHPIAIKKYMSAAFECNPVFIFYPLVPDLLVSGRSLHRILRHHATRHLYTYAVRHCSIVGIEHKPVGIRERSTGVLDSVGLVSHWLPPPLVA